MEWNDETIDRLRILWVEGHSTAEIGRRLLISKNAVVGKAHRLNLPARPSPIRRERAEGAPLRHRPARRVVGSTLPPLPAASETSISPDGPVHEKVPPVPAPRSVCAASEPAPKLAAVGVVGRSRRLACCWPIGDPGTRGFRFCDAEAVPGKPYCADHARLAYVKVRDRRDEAA